MPLDWLLHGFRGAVDRLTEAVASDEETARSVSISAFEAANWLDAIAGREQIAGDHRIKALLYARNRLHHQWSAGMHVDQALGTWVWYQTANIRLPDDERYLNPGGERAYEQYLAGRPVLEAFTHASEYLQRRWPEGD
jgi:hypothetical protein